VGPRACLDDMKRKFLTLPGLELRPLGHPARSQSLYGRYGPIPTTLSRLEVHICSIDIDSIDSILRTARPIFVCNGCRTVAV
jgi:hypothetical protein